MSKALDKPPLDRDWGGKICRCGVCGAVGRCTPDQDFFVCDGEDFFRCEVCVATTIPKGGRMPQ